MSTLGADLARGSKISSREAEGQGTAGFFRFSLSSKRKGKTPALEMKTLAPDLDPAERLWTESGLGINTALLLASCHWEQWALGPRHAPSFWIADWLASPWVMGQEFPVLLRWAPVLVKHQGKV